MKGRGGDREREKVRDRKEAKGIKRESVKYNNNVFLPNSLTRFLGLNYVF